MALWRAVQVRNGPVAASQYDPRVLTALGADDVIGALASQQAELAVTTPKVVAADKTQLGRLVIVNVESRGKAVGRHSFLVRQRNGRWVILFDTLLADSLEGYVTGRVQQELNPSAKSPSPRAVQTGAAAVRRYRALFVKAPASAPAETAGGSAGTPGTGGTGGTAVTPPSTGVTQP